MSNTYTKINNTTLILLEALKNLLTNMWITEVR